LVKKAVLHVRKEYGVFFVIRFKTTENVLLQC